MLTTVYARHKHLLRYWVWTFHQLNVGRFIGPKAAQARPGWVILMQGPSLLGQSSRYMAMITRAILIKLFKAWSMIVVLIQVYISLISWQSRHSSAPNWHAFNYQLSYTVTKHLFADGFVTVGPIAMKFWWYQEIVLGLKFRKFHLNPSNCNRKLTMMFKLDLKKIRLPHLDP